MRDIVERLRDEVKESETRCRCMCHEAAAEIERLRARVAELEAQRDRWKAIAEKRHAILLDLEWVVDAKDGDGSYCPYCMSMDDEVHVAGCKMAEAIAESARAANGGGE